MELRLELLTVPVSDVDRAKAFYVEQVGFSTEQDVRVDEEHRFVELMPPGSRCSIALTTGYIDSEPGSVKGIQVNVDDVEAVHAMLRDRGVDVSDIQEYPWGPLLLLHRPRRQRLVGPRTAAPRLNADPPRSRRSPRIHGRAAALADGDA